LYGLVLIRWLQEPILPEVGFGGVPDSERAGAPSKGAVFSLINTTVRVGSWRMGQWLHSSWGVGRVA
jgi:hypothetical protein